MKAIRGQDLKKIHIGQLVIAVTGPGDFPKLGRGSKNGVVVGTQEDDFGVFLKVEWENPMLPDMVSSLKDPSDRGVGVYAYPSLQAAIS